MKNLILIIFTFFIFSAKHSTSSPIDSTKAISHEVSVFEYDTAQINEGFKKLNELEFRIKDKHNFSLSNLKFPIAKKSYEISPEMLNNMTFKDEEVFALMLGCCLGPFGVAAIFIGAEDQKNQITLSMAGCLVPTITIVGYTLYYYGYF